MALKKSEINLKYNENILGKDAKEDVGGGDTKVFKGKDIPNNNHKGNTNYDDTNSEIRKENNDTYQPRDDAGHFAEKALVGKDTKYAPHGKGVGSDYMKLIADALHIKDLDEYQMQTKMTAQQMMQALLTKQTAFKTASRVEDQKTRKSYTRMAREGYDLDYQKKLTDNLEKAGFNIPTFYKEYWGVLNDKITKSIKQAGYNETYRQRRKQEGKGAGPTVPGPTPTPTPTPVNSTFPGPRGGAGGAAKPAPTQAKSQNQAPTQAKAQAQTPETPISKFKSREDINNFMGSKDFQDMGALVDIINDNNKSKGAGLVNKNKVPYSLKQAQDMVKRILGDRADELDTNEKNTVRDMYNANRTRQQQ